MQTTHTHSTLDGKQTQVHKESVRLVCLTQGTSIEAQIYFNHLVQLVF